MRLRRFISNPFCDELFQLDKSLFQVRFGGLAGATVQDLDDCPLLTFTSRVNQLASHGRDIFRRDRFSERPSPFFYRNTPRWPSRAAWIALGEPPAAVASAAVTAGLFAV